MTQVQESKKNIWFRAKRYGYGWYPITWQGWIVLLAYIVILIGVFYFVRNFVFDAFGIFMWFLIAAALTILLIAVCHHKGEPAHWRWGDKEK